MVEDSKKRARGQRMGTTPAGKGRISHTAAVTAADQDAFAAFTSKYRDMLRFADADEAEAVYSMVSLTQAAHQQGDWHAAAAHIKGPVIEVPECRAVKRRPVQLAVPASSACSEGGSSDSSSKSAPGPPQHMHQQHWQHSMQAHQQGPSMLAAALGPASARQAGAGAAAQQQQAQAGDGGASWGAGGDVHPGALGPLGGMQMHMGMSMPMAPQFFPAGMMMGGAPGCPPAHYMPFLPPWGMNPAMMQSMMFGGLPLPLPLPPAGMMPFMPGMHGLPGMMAPGPAAAEPAAGIPVSGPLPPAGNAFKAAACGPASKGASAAACAPAQGGGRPAAPAAPQASQAAPSTPAGAAGAAQLRPVSQPQHPAAAPAAECVFGGSVLCELEQLDVVALRPWVVDHFCEDVYLLLLDVWRPDSPKVREALWAWKLHVQGPRPQGAQPDYRAFLVSLFGLDRLTQLSAAAQAARQGSTTLTKVASSTPAVGAAARSPAVQPPAAAAAAAHTAGAADGEGFTPEGQGAACGGVCEAAVTTSNLSSEPGAALTAPGPHVMNILVPASKAGGGASATSPHREQLELQQQQLPLA